MNKKKKYETPEMKMLIIELDDIIATSAGENGLINGGLGAGDEWNVEGADWFD